MVSNDFFFLRKRHNIVPEAHNIHKIKANISSTQPLTLLSRLGKLSLQSANLAFYLYSIENCREIYAILCTGESLLRGQAVGIREKIDYCCMEHIFAYFYLYHHTNLLYFLPIQHLFTLSLSLNNNFTKRT